MAKSVILYGKKCNFICLPLYIPKIKELVHNPFIIIRNNTSYHCSQHTKEWIKNKIKEILDWPPNSPNLNPIENVWDNKGRETEEKY